MKKTHIKDYRSKHRSKKNEKKNISNKVQLFLFGNNNNKKIPLATINWQMRNWLCGSEAGIFRWHQLLCHYCGWPEREWGRSTAGSWLGSDPWPRSTPVQPCRVRLPSEPWLSPAVEIPVGCISCFQIEQKTFLPQPNPNPNPAGLCQPDLHICRWPRKQRSLQWCLLICHGKEWTSTIISGPTKILRKCSRTLYSQLIQGKKMVVHIQISDLPSSDRQTDRQQREGWGEMGGSLWEEKAERKRNAEGERGRDVKCDWKLG